MLKSSIQRMFSDHMFKDELTIILLKLFQKIVEKGTLHNSVWGQCYSDMYKSDKDITIKLQTNISYEDKWKNPQQNTCKLNLEAYKNNYKPRPSEINPSNTKLVQHMKINE